MHWCRVFFGAVALLFCFLACASHKTAGTGGTESAVDGMRAWGHLLGLSKGQVEAQVKGKTDAQAEGWVSYGDGLRIKYDGGTAVALAQPVPEGLGCKEAARWAGFVSAASPMLRKNRCVWPSEDPPHALGKGVAGALVLDERILEARVVP